MLPVSPAQSRHDLSARLQARREEIEQAILNRVHAVADPGETGDLEYLEGLRAAVAAALDYALLAVECGEEQAPALPASVLAQARLAARYGVALDTVLRRYFAGYSLLADFLIGEVERRNSREGGGLQEVLRSHAVLFDRLLIAVSEEYNREAQQCSRGSTKQRRIDCVRCLLNGELIDPIPLRYRLDGWHLAVIASGPGIAEALRDLAAELERSLLLVCPEGVTAWAWLGGHDRLVASRARERAHAHWPAETFLAIGEPGHGLGGWRLSHRQARAAFTVALREGPSLASYSDVALLAAALGDEILADSLRTTYVVPLESDRDGGAGLLETLRAYFAAQRNVSSAAARLGVSRQTVSVRLRIAEDRIDRPLQDCMAEVETALRLCHLGHGTVPRGR